MNDHRDYSSRRWPQSGHSVNDGYDDDEVSLADQFSQRWGFQPQSQSKRRKIGSVTGSSPRKSSIFRRRGSSLPNVRAARVISDSSRKSAPIGGKRPSNREVNRGFRRRYWLPHPWIIFVLLSLLVAGSAYGIKAGLEIFIGKTESTAVQTPVEPVRPHTPPLDFTGFNPGFIITDDSMLNWTSMTEKQIQDFLDKAGQGCIPGKTADGRDVPCLAKYTTDTQSYPADSYCTQTFVGAKNDTAASIIAKTARACGINPKVLLVTLQKEQGLLTAWGPRLVESRYRVAMGYACPDHAKCDPRYEGFGKQVYFAAKQLQRYRVDPNAPSYPFKAGRTFNIRTGPSNTCSRRQIKIENWATAALYNYTPYAPQEGALGGSDGGVCDNPGNALFYAYFKAYFPKN